MKNRKFAGLVFTFLLSSMYFSSVAYANLIVDPARLGVLRLQLYPLSPAVAVKELRVGNTYDEPMDIQLVAIEGIENVTTFSETSFTLPPNSDKTIEYTVSINEPGYYQGAVQVRTTRGTTSTFAYSADLEIYVYQSNLKPYLYVAIAVIVIVVAVVVLLFVRKATKKKSARKKSKR